METLNWWAIAVITVVSFLCGNLWFGALFGKSWMKIHGMENKSKAEMAKAMEGMGKIMASELAATILMTIGLACAIANTPDYSGVQVAFFIWLGFVLPMCVSNVLWGNDPKKYMVQKIALTSGYRLVLFLIAGYVLTIWK